MAVGARHTSAATALRTLAAARKRTAAVVQAEVDAMEAAYLADAVWRKDYAHRNVARWTAIRRARGAG
jgi:hypothetical protein